MYDTGETIGAIPPEGIREPRIYEIETDIRPYYGVLDYLKASKPFLVNGKYGMEEGDIFKLTLFSHSGKDENEAESGMAAKYQIYGYMTSRSSYISLDRENFDLMKEMVEMNWPRQETEIQDPLHAKD